MNTNEACKLTTYQLRELCIRENWFTNGCIDQYNTLFKRLNEGAPFDEIVIIIWICSNGVSAQEISTKIHHEEERLCYENTPL